MGSDWVGWVWLLSVDSVWLVSVDGGRKWPKPSEAACAGYHKIEFARLHEVHIRQ